MDEKEKRPYRPAATLPRGESKRLWTLREAADRPGVLQLYIYGDVEGDWYDWWTDEKHESETSANFFRRELAKYPGVQEIEIFINSYGGSVYEGTAIYNQLRRHPARKTVYIDGFACSIASVIAMAGDEIVMPRNTLMMIHNMWMGAVGNAEELRKAADDLDTINAAGRQAYLLKAGERLSEERLREMMDEETWLTAEECLALGLADRYTDEDADLGRAKEILQRANDGLQRQVARQRELAAALREARENAEKADGDLTASRLEREKENTPIVTAAGGDDTSPKGGSKEPERTLMAFLAGVEF